MYDPWTASLDDARTEHDSAGYDAGDPTGPLWQWEAVQRIRKKKPDVEKGIGFALLACVGDILYHGLIAPEWLSLAFGHRLMAVVSFKAKSWDDPKVFGKPYPKGLNRAAAERRRVRQWQVWHNANGIKRREPDTPIDEAFFERVGREVHPPCGKTEASELYYKMKKRLG